MVIIMLMVIDGCKNGNDDDDDGNNVKIYIYILP